jgi:uncharacterized protein with GYD domain
MWFDRREPTGRNHMPRFITLVSLMPGTDDGSVSVAALSETLRVQLQSGEIGGTEPEVHATLGEFDFVVISEIADAERAAAYATVVREKLHASVVTLAALDAQAVDTALGGQRTDGVRPAIGRS